MCKPNRGRASMVLQFDVRRYLSPGPLSIDWRGQTLVLVHRTFLFPNGTTGTRLRLGDCLLHDPTETSLIPFGPERFCSENHHHRSINREKIVFREFSPFRVL